MNTPEINELNVTYMDGTHSHFTFPSQTDSLTMASLVQKLLTTNALALQLGDRLLVIPTANIRSAEISPCPGKLPDIVIQNVERVLEPV
ncbi:MAG: hypothetical protein ACXWIU_01580 [Limisphaerales bacterium]